MLVNLWLKYAALTMLNAGIYSINNFAINYSNHNVIYDSRKYSDCRDISV